MAVKIYSKGNFFFVVYSNTVVFSDYKQSTFPFKNKESDTTYNFLFKTTGKNLNTIAFTDIIDENSIAYASQAIFETWLYENTGISASTGGGGVTNLSYTASSTSGIVTSDTGTDATIPLANGTNSGLLSPAFYTILTNTSGTNTGDQTSIVGISGTKVEFNTALTDGDFAFQSDLALYVPYTGATSDTDLGSYKLNAASLHIKGTGGTGHLGLKYQSSSATASAGEIALFANNVGNLAWKNDGGFVTTFASDTISADRVYTFPNTSGTVALTSDLSSYQPALSGTGFVKISGTTISYDNSTYLTGNQTISLSGDASGSGATSISVSISDSIVTGKLLTGYTSGAGTVAATDSILQAIQKLNGNIGTKQDTLVSGTNIKTVNSTSLLGSGDISVEPTITAGTTSQYWRGDKTWQTLDKSAVGLGSVENTALSTWNGSSNITTLGTIGSGIWNGSAISDTYISSASTWNAKVSSTRSISVSSPLTGGGDLSADRTIGISQATASTNGYLSSTDWNTFNNKQGTITLTTTGSSGAATLVGNTLNIPQYTGGAGSFDYGQAYALNMQIAII